MSIRERLDEMERQFGFQSKPLPPEMIEEFNERAAICQFHGELSEEEAERVAMECVRRIMGQRGEA